jgi:hypothetical protein
VNILVVGGWNGLVFLFHGVSEEGFQLGVFACEGAGVLGEREFVLEDLSGNSELYGLA